MLKSITLRNWRSHKHSTIEFPKGTTLILGRMGAGKSSVLDAICFALFGTFPQIKGREYGLQEVIRDGENWAEVELHFTIETDEFMVKRRVEGKSTKKAELRKNGALIETKPTLVNELLAKITGIDYDTYVRALYSRQNELNHFLTATPAERKAEIDRILGVEKFERARANCRTLINRVKRLKALLEQQVNPEEVEKRREKINLMKKEVEELENRTSPLYQKVKQAYETAKQTKEEYEHVQKQALEKQDLLRKIADIKGKIEGLSHDLSSSFDELDQRVKEKQAQMIELEKESAGIKERLKRKKEAFTYLLQQISYAKERQKRREEISKHLSTLTQQLSDFGGENQIQHLENHITTLEQNITQLSSDMISLEKEQEEINKTFVELKSGSTHCPVCHSPLDNQKIEHIKQEKLKRLGAIEKQKEEKRKLRTEMTSQLKQAKEELKKLQQLVLRKKELEEQLNQLKGDDQNIAEQNKKLEQIKIEVEDLETKLRKMGEVLTQTRDKINRLNEEKRKHMLVEKLKKEQEVLHHRASSLHVDEEKLNHLAKVYEERLERYNHLKEKYSVMVNELKNKKQLLTLLTEDQEKDEKRLEKINHYSTLHDELCLFYDALLEVQEQMRKTVIARINECMHVLWKALYPYDDFSTVQLFIDGQNYTFKLLRGDKWFDVARVSGGEKTCVALSFRVALASLYTKETRFLILDEPTHNLDEEGIARLSKALEKFLPGLINQTIVISHDQSLCAVSWNKNYVIENKEGVSVVKEMNST